MDFGGVIDTSAVSRRGGVGGFQGASGVSGGAGLGGTVFTVTADTSQFTAALSNAEKQAKEFSSKASKSFQDSGRGILQLAYAIDDLQYGFKSIVNNLPQIASAFGGSAGVAGVIGIAAVAVNQLISHWDELSDKLENTNLGNTVQGIFQGISEAIKDSDSNLRKFMGAIGVEPIGDKGATLDHDIPGKVFDWLMGGPGAKDANAIKRAQEARQDALKNGKGVAHIMGTEDEARAKDFKAAIAAYGGDQKLRDDAFKAAIAATPGTPQDLLRVRINDMINQGLAGKDVNSSLLGKGFGDAIEGVKQARALDARANLDAADAKDWLRQQREDAADIEKNAKIGEAIMKDQIRDNIDQDRKRIEQLQKKQADIGQIQIYGGMEEFLSARQSNVTNSMIKPIAKEIDRVVKEIHDLNQLLQRMPGRAG